VKCDHRAVSHDIRIVGIIYEIANYGGPRIITVAGISSTGTRKLQWWIPPDQYVVRYGANKEANILPELLKYVQQYLMGPSTLMTKHQDAQFKRRTK
jgi:hypothetical protein